MDNPESMVKALKRIPWFLELSPNQIEALAKIAVIRSLSSGEILFNEGDSEDCLYILMEGQVDAEVHVPGRGVVHLYRAEPLDVVGWSVLTPVVRQRTVTIRAASDVRLLCFNSLILRQVCETDHDLGFIVMRRIANVVASRLLVTRLQLFELLHQTDTLDPVNQHKHLQ
jgi:CRP/FNR family transcriptional regulator, cyclic AMP receptor protein